MVNKCSDENPYKLIKVSDLVKTYNIENYFWRDYKEVKDYIKALNNSSKVLSMPQDNIILPSIDEFFEANKGIEKLKRAVRGVFDTNRELYKLAVKAEKFVEKQEEYLNEIEDLKGRIHALKKTIQKQNEEIDILYIDSKSSKTRAELGLKKNLIELKPNDKRISKDIKDIKEAIPGLFDDVD